MLFSITLSILAGIFFSGLCLKSNKTLFIRGRHFHHTFTGIFLCLIALFLILNDRNSGIYLAGFGIGVMVHHLISEKNLKIITREEHKKTGLLDFRLYSKS